MRKIQVFSKDPWFVGKDVAQVLGYAKPENALAAHVDEEDKTTTLIQGTGSNYKSKAIIINESGLYALILSSKALADHVEVEDKRNNESLLRLGQRGGWIINVPAVPFTVNDSFAVLSSWKNSGGNNLATNLQQKTI